MGERTYRKNKDSITTQVVSGPISECADAAIAHFRFSGCFRVLEVLLFALFSGKMISMCKLDEICAKRDEIYAIAKSHKAEKLWVFGSCARKAVI